ncbi:LysR substrate-binding domain-containing protein [Vibrio sp. S4M6]|uniref:LysR substrate-binding domain-containing protein n=1 Tax=Vibrio sinus TaxID=2946865 RepID=UPI002029BCAF|nr:LysR substrate-binding domain-containing protein [Vibrio sinus]MCL9782113.1 LysR substrate-binding domain-containing protein [Vibrio sinus]
MKHLRSNMASALMTFVDVGRYGSLTSAAKAKHLTTGAVSQQLLQLEENIGTTLLNRHSRGVTLTEAGSLLHRVALSSFQDIDRAIATIQGQVSTISEVRLRLTPSFAFKWLVPRLEEFHRLYPDIQIQIYAESALVDQEATDFDLAIDYGPIPYRDVNAEMLLAEQLVPVMSRSYLAKYDGLSEKPITGKEWAEVTLLHDAKPWSGAVRHHEWEFWAERNGVTLPLDKGHFFNRADMAMSAAEAGVGIALARRALIQDELSSGRLVAPLSTIEADAGYYLISHTSSPAGECFTKWLRTQVSREG